MGIRRYLVAAILFISILVFFYKTRERVPFYDFNPPFNNSLVATLNPDSLEVFKFNLCSLIETNFSPLSDWDSIVFVTPYMDLSLIWSLRLSNFWSIWWHVLQLKGEDGIETLLFVKDKRIIGFGTIYRIPIVLDYTRFKSQLPVVPIIKKSYCPNMYLERKQYKEEISYLVVIR